MLFTGSLPDGDFRYIQKILDYFRAQLQPKLKHLTKKLKKKINIYPFSKLFKRGIGPFIPSLLQVHEEFKQNVENIGIDNLIQKFAEQKGTGKERPGRVIEQDERKMKSKECKRLELDILHVCLQLLLVSRNT